MSWRDVYDITWIGNLDYRIYYLGTSKLVISLCFPSREAAESHAAALFHYENEEVEELLLFNE